jgi:hypothetical protein
LLENTFVEGAESAHPSGPKIPAPDGWTHIQRYSCHATQGENLVNGVLSSGEIVDWAPAATEPDFDTIAGRHYSPGPSFEDADAVNVRDFGAQGDGETDDTAAFQKAIHTHDKVFVPKGDYIVSKTLHLRPNTYLFGLSPALTSLGSQGETDGNRRRQSADDEPFTIETVDDAKAAPGLSFLSLRGRVNWQSGRGTWMLSRGRFHISGNGGGRFYGVMAMGRPLILSGLRQPTAFYALNVERVTVNPQSQIENCSGVRIYYFKVEAGTIQRPGAGDGNTPCRISDSHDIGVYCMYGNVRQLGGRPMLEVVDSDQVVVSQVKAFRAAEFSHLVEMRGQEKHEVPSSRICALFLRFSDKP